MLQGIGMIFSAVTPKTFKTLPTRWQHYQRERLPLWKALPVVAAKSYSAVTFTALIAHRGLPGWGTYLVTFLIGMLFHLQRRIGDDLHNAAHDRKNRPFMPIPRGLVSANELRLLFALCIPVQALLSMALDVRLLGPLLIVLIFLQGLTFDFGLRFVIQKHPVFGLFLRMLAAPLVMYFATACEWLPRGDSPPVGVILLLMVTFSNSFVLELGRKIRAPSEVVPDPLSYSTLWGPRRSVVTWWLLINVSAIFSTIARAFRGAPPEGILVLFFGVIFTAFFAYHFASSLKPAAAKRLEFMSVLWTVTMFLTLVLR